ncbi:MAG: RNA polymerase sigma factor [Bacteroidales bacterium]|jgi:RNA polymerase sigma-70 factor (ECF subfamily)|nr:RNA polymerase sigma factor [Bacteroidales bacterium]
MKHPCLFEAIIAKHQRNVLKRLNYLTKDISLSMDLLQETLLRAYSNKELLLSIDEGGHRYWLLKVAENVVIDHYRQKQRRSIKLEKDIIDIRFNLGWDINEQYYISEQFDTHEQCADTEQDKLKSELVENLIKQRFKQCFLLRSEILVLKYYHIKGFSYVESAKKLGCSPSAARRYYMAAIKKIHINFKKNNLTSTTRSPRCMSQDI